MALSTSFLRLQQRTAHSYAATAASCFQRAWNPLQRSCTAFNAATFATSTADVQTAPEGATGAAQAPLKVCVVGSGPAGFYTSKYILKQHPTATVDLYERLPMPYGLVRYGVAPDHPEVKTVINDFDAVAEDARFSFVGGVEVGKHIELSELQAHYNAVIMATGAQSDKPLAIENADKNLSNVFSAREFVNWYNGHPDFTDLNPNLKVSDVAIIGQGNVALDCARLLAKTRAELADTDIADYALEALAESEVKRVSVIGRRSHVQAAFTTKELREMTKLEAASLTMLASDYAKADDPENAKEIKSTRICKRIHKLLGNHTANHLDTDTPDDFKQVFLRFLRAPTALIPSIDDDTKVQALRCAVTKLVGEAGCQRAEVDSSQGIEDISAQLILVSIGYDVMALSGYKWPVGGSYQVQDEQGDEVPGMFCTGWARRGPHGIIATNIDDARQVARAVIDQHEAGALPSTTSSSPREAIIDALLQAGTLSSKDIVDWQGVLRIKDMETQLGKTAGKSCGSKIVDWDGLFGASRA